MSKQSEAKTKQGYCDKSPTCGDCKHLKFDMVPPKWMVEDNISFDKAVKEGRKVWGSKHDLEAHARQKNLRCGIGGFAVKKLASCAEITI